jgi:hypothetical protein
MFGMKEEPGGKAGCGGEVVAADGVQAAERGVAYLRVEDLLNIIRVLRLE